MKLQFLFLLVILLAFVMLPMLSIAQPVEPPVEPVDAPIDGGLSILLAAGVGYGVKKMRDARKHKPSEKHK